MLTFGLDFFVLSWSVVPGRFSDYFWSKVFVLNTILWSPFYPQEGKWFNLSELIYYVTRLLSFLTREDPISYLIQSVQEVYELFELKWKTIMMTFITSVTLDLLGLYISLQNNSDLYKLLLTAIYISVKMPPDIWRILFASNWMSA